MASFYGNIKNNSRSSFIFDRIYSSRCEMEKALYETKDANGAIAGDGVFINRYVLINYGYAVNGTYTLVYLTSDENCEINASNYGEYYYIQDSSIHPQYYNKEKNKYYLPANVYAQSNDIRPWEVAQNTTEYYKKEIFVNRFDSNLNENIYYKTNRENDRKKYYASFDHTVWQKIYSDNQEKYILVAELNSDAPTYELITDAPGSMDGAPHFDLSLSSELNYVYHVPKNWNIILNEYDPKEDYSDNTINTYWYYENDLIDADKTFKFKEEYPFINKEGFNPNTHIIKPVQDEGFHLVETKSGMEYTIHQYRPIQLTVDTYAKNRYFILTTQPQKIVENNQENPHVFSKHNDYFISDKNDPIIFISCPLNKISDGLYAPLLEKTNDQAYYYVENIDHAFTLSLTDYNPSIKYYELTTLKYNDIYQKAPDKDTKRLDILLPSIGNAVATMYDFIYGKPRYKEHNIIGYTTTEKLKNYDQQDFASYEIQNSQYNLKTEEVNDLVVPVYMTNTGELYKYIKYQYFDNFIEVNRGQFLIFGKQYNADINTLSQVPEESQLDAEIPVYQNIDNILGYTSQNSLISYESTDNDNVKILNETFYLTDEEINSLSPELVPGYFDIPVYAIKDQNQRPYNEEKLLNTFVAPYDALDENTDISMGWALDALKKYMSELRYLANGNNSTNALGLQSDWTLDDDQSFGYIYHKPDIITAFIPTTDDTVVAGKSYYQKTYDSDVTSINYGVESFILANNNTITNPASNSLYEIPATMLKNAETDTYRPEDVIGYIDRATYNVWLDQYQSNIETDYYSGEGESKYYYDLTQEQAESLQKYQDDTHIITIKKSNIEFNYNVNNDPYFIYDGNRYVKAYQTIGTYFFNPLLTSQYINPNKHCNCYFDDYQQITVQNGQIIQRKYRFISKGSLDDNIWLVANNKRIEKFYIVIGGDTSELEIKSDSNGDFISEAIEYLSRQDLINYLVDQRTIMHVPTRLQDTMYEQVEIENEDMFNNNKTDYYTYENGIYTQCDENSEYDNLTQYYIFIGVELPAEPTVEVISVYSEQYDYKDRFSPPLDYAQYVTIIEQIELTDTAWQSQRNNGIKYYLRSYKPVAQIDYEINTIWNSINIDD